MSEYGTEQFIDWLGGQISTHPYITPVVTRTTAKENKAMLNAIIAKLRAGDKLENKSLMKLAEDLGVPFSAAKILEDHVRKGCAARLRAGDKLCHAVKHAQEQEDLDKAIAEYEGKEW